MSFVLMEQAKRPWKIWKFCDGCRNFETKKYTNNVAGRAKMNQEADKHYQKCSRTQL